MCWLDPSLVRPDNRDEFPSGACTDSWLPFVGDFAIPDDQRAIWENKKHRRAIQTKEEKYEAAGNMANPRGAEICRRSLRRSVYGVADSRTQLLQPQQQQPPLPLVVWHEWLG